jgi:hypothetical protein
MTVLINWTASYADPANGGYHIIILAYFPFLSAYVFYHLDF